MSQLKTILGDIQTLLVGNAGSVSVFREDYVPTELGTRRDVGYLVWDFNIDTHEQNNCHYTGNVFGTLFVTSYAVTRTTRDTVHTNVQNLFHPLTGNYRTSVAPKTLGSTWLHYANLEDVREVALSKEGHMSPETPGIMCTYELKLSTLGV
mgnify:FL=1